LRFDKAQRCNMLTIIAIRNPTQQDSSLRASGLSKLRKSQAALHPRSPRHDDDYDRFSKQQHLSGVVSRAGLSETCLFAAYI